MDYLQQSFGVRFEYKVFFTDHLFDRRNHCFADFLQTSSDTATRKKIFFVVDGGVLHHHPGLLEDVRSYFRKDLGVVLASDMLVIPGGEAAKNDERLFYQIVAAVNQYGIDRHSYVAAIGGGAVLDLTGYAAAVCHRGIRHIRIPTTVLAQNDSGVGVKNGINFLGKKNFLGSFAPPAAVFNDAHFLTTLDDRDWRGGVSEAIKVALIKDASFFEWLELHAAELAAREMAPMQYLIRRCAELHLQHIAGGDPFEMGSSRPLDFGHWSAHKLEQLTHFTVRHGEAVAMGIALDVVYSYLLGWLPEADMHRIISLIRQLGFGLFHPLLGDVAILQGLQEFQEHLGGRLTIMLLQGIGKGVEVHEMNTGLIEQASQHLKKFSWF